jgi:hypothetical protein
MTPAGFETAIPASERPQTYALDGAATVIGEIKNYGVYIASSGIKFIVCLEKLDLLDDENLAEKTKQTYGPLRG